MNGDNVIDFDKMLSFFNEVKGKIEKYIVSIDNINPLDLDELNKVLSNISKGINRLSWFETNPNEWEKFNVQYKNYFIHKYKNVIREFNPIYSYFYDLSTDSGCQNLFREVKRLNSIYDENLMDIYDYFRYGDNNYILFGKNGAGKTTLLNKLSSEIMAGVSLVAKATRQIGYDTNVYHQQSEITLSNALNSQENNRTMYFLAMCVRERELSEWRSHINENLIITKKMIRIFDSLGIDRKLKTNPNGDLLLYSTDDVEYSLSSASDGEKTILYFIMMVLLSPMNSFVFIDEPENHLNGMLMKKLFNVLEIERNDLKFIYATHNISFVESRKNVQLIYLEKTNRYNSWKLKEINSFKDIPLDLIINIEGTNDNVIFCEGNDNKSLDSKLYSALFPQYQIISSNGCDKVIYQTEMFNSNSKILKRSAIGIVDNDFRTNEEIEELYNKKVNVLQLNEIENVYLLDSCIDKVLVYIKSSKTIENVKNHVINTITNNVDSIKKDYATKTFRKLHLKNKFININDINSELKRINAENDNLFLTKYNEYVQNFESFLQMKNYAKLMQYVPGKSLIAPVAQFIGISVENYINILLSIISTDDGFAQSIRSIAFSKKF